MIHGKEHEVVIQGWQSHGASNLNSEMRPDIEVRGQLDLALYVAHEIYLATGMKHEWKVIEL